MASIPIVFELLRPRPNTAARFSRIVALAVMLLACLSATATADERAGTTPLTPLDTSSPRATLRSFCDTVDRIFVNLTTAERTLALRAETRHLIQQAVTCLDISAIAPTLVDSESRQSIVCLKEVLDRIELPRAADIPDAAAAKADGLKRWRLPGTEIMLTRISDGPREGDFVFSAETVTQAARFYDLIRLLPYRSDAGSPGLHEAYVTLGGWMIPETFIRGLPAWAHAKILGETLWQWTATLLLLMASTAAVWHAWKLPRRQTGSASRDVVGRLLFPAVLIAVSLICDNLLTFQIRLTGDNLLAVKLFLRVVTLVGVLGGVLVTMSWLCDLLINIQGMRPEAIDSQLIRLGGKVLTFIIVSWILLNAADSIGIPVTPLMAGLGAGGLALALASQYTLENLIAGLVIFADKPVRIGDDCQFGGVRGRVERIGLRSTRIRGADRSIISVPNAEFAKMQLVNFTARDHIPLAISLTLQPDIAPRPLRKLLERLHRVLVDHPRLANEPASARLSSATPSAITVEVSAIALTGDDDEHLAIREEVLLTMMEVIRSCGCDTSAEPTVSPAIMRAAA
ncbi:MAG: mechanosensitive ion channel [Planctomycetia bacterium]|nr:mechanosensitive ion channel [Planctomycetia bacterium]